MYDAPSFLHALTALSSGLNAWYFTTLAVGAPERRLGASILALVCLGTLLATFGRSRSLQQPIAGLVEVVVLLGSLAITTSIVRHVFWHWTHRNRGEE